MRRTIWLSAAHEGTVGAGREGLYEEHWSEPIIIQATNRLRDMGHTNVVHMGVNGHEMDQDDDGSIGNEDVVISLHFNVGNAMVLYNQNPASIDWIDAYFRAHLPGEISYSGKIRRDDLDMLHGDYDNAERYLLEMGDVRDADDRAWMSNQEFMINFLVCLVLEIFLGAGPQNPHNGANGQQVAPSPTPQPQEPIIPWYDYIKGQVHGSETVVDAYEEQGTFVFDNIPRKLSTLSIYPDFQQAMTDTQADPNVFMENSDEITYWGVVRTDKYDYLLYDRDSGAKGCVSIRDKEEGHSYGYVK